MTIRKCLPVFFPPLSIDMPILDTSSPRLSNQATRPLRNSNIKCNEVLNDAVLYDSLREHVYALNHSAYMIWQRCDGTASIDDMASEFADTLDITYEELVAQITSIVDNLSQLDLLHDNSNGPFQQLHHTIQIQHNRYQVHIHTNSLEVQKILSNVLKL